MAKAKTAKKIVDAVGTRRAKAAGYAQETYRTASGNLKSYGKENLAKDAMRGATYGAGVGAVTGGAYSGLQGDSIIGGAARGAMWGAAGGGAASLSKNALGATSYIGEGGIRESARNLNNRSMTRARDVGVNYNTGNVSKDVFNMERLQSSLRSNPLG